MMMANKNVTKWNLNKIEKAMQENNLSLFDCIGFVIEHKVYFLLKEQVPMFKIKLPEIGEIDYGSAQR